MRNLLFAFAALVAVATTPVLAQTPPPDAEAVAAARELATSLKLTDQLKTMMPIMMQAIKPAIVQGRPQVERDYNAITRNVLQSFESQSEAMINDVVKLYAGTFTAAELREITAFYQGSTGRKVLRLLPQLMQQGIAIGQAYARKAEPEMRRRIIEELRKRGHDI